MYTLNELKDRLLSDLKEIAEQLSVGNFKRLSKQDLIYKILDHQATLPAEQFIRVHKSYLVALRAVRKIERHQVTVGTVTIPLAESYREALQGRLLRK